MQPIRALILAVPLLLLQTACTIVRVDGASQIAQSDFGVLRVEPSPDARLTVIRLQGVGLVPGTTGTTFGVRSETVAMVHAPEDCRIVIMEATPDEVERLAALLEGQDGGDGICVVGGTDEEES